MPIFVLTTDRSLDPFGWAKWGQRPVCFFLDEPFQVLPHRRSYRFRQAKLEIGPSDFHDAVTVFMPVADFLEVPQVDGTTKLFLGLLLCGAPQIRPRWLNPPPLWRLAVSKEHNLEFLSRLGIRVPITLATDTPHELQALCRQRKFVIKTGYSVNRTIGGNKLKPALVTRATNLSEWPLGYKAILQEYIHSKKEYRVYSFRSKTAIDSIVIQTPIGTSYCPDWRFRERDGAWKARRAKRPEKIAAMAARCIEAFQLNYLCLDIIFDGTDYYIIDVNPHGTWDWLPASLSRPIQARFFDLVLSAV